MQIKLKIRNIPFGYVIKDGSVDINPIEEKLFHQIVSLYLSGASLQTIANTFNEDQIEYRSGVAGWNSSRIRRILTDRRHLGTDQFPSILNADKYKEVILLMRTRSSQSGINRGSTIYNLGASITCASCGSHMHRKQDTRYKIPQRWICTNKDCDIRVPISDDSLIQSLIHTMNSLINSPDSIQIVQDESITSTAEALQLENEINRSLENVIIDKEALICKILQCTSLKYNGINQLTHTSMQIKHEFEIAKPSQTYPHSLVSHTVSEILLEPNGYAGLLLISGQRIGKEL